MKTTNNKKKLFLGLVSVIKTLIFFLLSKYIKKDYWSHNNMDHGGNTTNCTVCVDFLPVQISSRVCNIFCDIPTVLMNTISGMKKGLKMCWSFLEIEF